MSVRGKRLGQLEPQCSIGLARFRSSTARQTDIGMRLRNDYVGNAVEGRV